MALSTFPKSTRQALEEEGEEEEEEEAEEEEKEERGLYFIVKTANYQRKLPFDFDLWNKDPTSSCSNCCFQKLVQFQARISFFFQFFSHYGR